MTRLDRVVVLALGLATASAGLAVHAAWPGVQYYRAGLERRQVQQLLERIAESADRFSRSLEIASAAERNLDDPQVTAEIRQAVNDIGQAAARLRGRASDLSSNVLGVEDVRELLRRRVRIDGFARRDHLDGDAARLWLSLREDVNRLARARAVASHPGDEVQ